MPKVKASQKSYSRLSKELDEIMTWFDSEEIDLDVALSKHESAMKIIDDMENYLKHAENKIKKIKAKLRS